MKNLRDFVLSGLFLALAGANSANADFLYVSRADIVTPANSSITRIDTTTKVETIFATTGLNNPAGIAFDRAGNLYVANGGNNTIEKFTPGGVGSVFASGGLLNSPDSLAFDSLGNLYVANRNSIERFTPGGVGSIFATNGVNGPRGLAIDSSNNVFVSNQATLGSEFIEKFTPGGVGSVFATTANGVNNPRGLAIDSLSNVYLVNASDQKVIKFTPGGLNSVYYNGNGVNTPVGLAFDGNDILYLANRDGLNILRIPPGTFSAEVFATESVAPYFLAFRSTAVPEPSTFALLGVGMGFALVARACLSRRSVC